MNHARPPLLESASTHAGSKVRQAGTPCWQVKTVKSATIMEITQAAPLKRHDATSFGDASRSTGRPQFALHQAGTQDNVPWLSA